MLHFFETCKLHKQSFKADTQKWKFSVPCCSGWVWKSMAQRSCDWHLFELLKRRNATLLGDQKMAQFSLMINSSDIFSIPPLAPIKKPFERECAQWQPRRRVSREDFSALRNRDSVRAPPDSQRDSYSLFPLSTYLLCFGCQMGGYQRTTSWWWLSFPSWWQTSPSSRLETASRLPLLLSGISAGLCFSKELGEVVLIILTDYRMGWEGGLNDLIWSEKSTPVLPRLWGNKILSSHKQAHTLVQD